MRANFRVQDTKFKLWDKVGVIVSISQYRSYYIKFATGNVLWRNRCFLRPIMSVTEPDAGDADASRAPSNDDNRSATDGSNTALPDGRDTSSQKVGEHPNASAYEGGGAPVTSEHILRRSGGNRKLTVRFDI